MRSSTAPKGRNVKSVQATDAHERAKDFLSATEVEAGTASATISWPS
jgi:hypothetical protein